MTMLGNNTKRGGDPRWDKYVLQELNKIGSKATVLGSLLQNVLSLLESKQQDMEIILVEWTNNGVVTILKEISTYTSGGALDRKYYNSAGVDVTEAVLASIGGGTGSISHIDPSAVLNLILTQLTPALRTHNTVVATGAGSIPVGSIRGSVFNAGSAAGVWNGISLPTGVSVPWEEVGNRDTYAAIGYDATGTTFLIEYTM